MPRLVRISTLPRAPLMGGHPLDRISVQFQNFSGHLPHNSSLTHELKPPPSCTTLPLPQPPPFPAQAETVLGSPGLESRATNHVAHASPPLMCDTSGVRVGLGRNRQRKVFSGEGLWPGRSQPTCGLSLLLQLASGEFSLVAMCPNASLQGKLLLVPPRNQRLGGAHRPLPAPHTLGEDPAGPRSSLPARLRTPLMYDNINRACST